MVVSHVENAYAADKIKVTLTINVPQLGPLSSGRHNRMSRQHAARDVALSKLQKPCGVASGGRHLCDLHDIT
jgi:hypothetical protein